MAKSPSFPAFGCIFFLSLSLFFSPTIDDAFLSFLFFHPHTPNECRIFSFLRPWTSLVLRGKRRLTGPCSCVVRKDNSVPFLSFAFLFFVTSPNVQPDHIGLLPSYFSLNVVRRGAPFLKRFPPPLCKRFRVTWCSFTCLPFLLFAAGGRAFVLPPFSAILFFPSGRNCEFFFPI